MAARFEPILAVCGVAPGLDRDDVSGHRTHLHGSGGPGDDVGRGQAAVQQQDVDQFTSAAASPLTRRVAAQNASWAAVKVPASRARANAVETGKAPGLILRTSK